MNRICLTGILLLFVTIVISEQSFAQSAVEKKATPVPKLYEGMNREELYKVYPLKYQISQYVKDNREVDIFNDYLTEQAGDSITVYLIDGKVKWWDKEESHATPEQRLKAILERNSYKESASQSDGRDGTIDSLKKDNRMSNTQRSATQKYLKNKY